MDSEHGKCQSVEILPIRVPCKAANFWINWKFSAGGDGVRCESPLPLTLYTTLKTVTRTLGALRCCVCETQPQFTVHKEDKLLIVPVFCSSFFGYLSLSQLFSFSVVLFFFPDTAWKYWVTLGCSMWGLVRSDLVVMGETFKVPGVELIYHHLPRWSIWDIKDIAVTQRLIRRVNKLTTGLYLKYFNMALIFYLHNITLWESNITKQALAVYVVCCSVCDSWQAPRNRNLGMT